MDNVSKKKTLQKNQTRKDKEWFDQECKTAMEDKNKARKLLIDNTNKQNEKMNEKAKE